MVTDADRAKMQRIGRDLEESETDDRGTPEYRRAVLASINARRAELGREPLDDRAPEEGFYDRARALGMARIDR